MPKSQRTKLKREYPWSHLVESILTRENKFNRRNAKVIFDAVKTRIQINALMKEIQNCKPDSPKNTWMSWKKSSSFGVSTSDLEEPKPLPPKKTAPAANQVEKVIQKGALDIAVSRNAMDKLEKSLSQADPSSENAARIRNQLTFYADSYKVKLKRGKSNEPSPTEEPFQIPPKDSPAETKPRIQASKVLKSKTNSFR
ncbi:hypothetical protein CEXT_585301 [Caerostris extrusa]|uniref:Uncharacterized protein n=1 Tax=Caerostris extrusa TaxID=172846 RepID=A0AAV4RNX0_CAEEX|nr:hypothetical protein CEXT_585301 [Caerostris extrusa]